MMHERLPEEMSIEEKCKRYAVLSCTALSKNLPYDSTVLKVLMMDRADLDYYQSRLNTTRLSLMYMIAIDRYRVTELAPPIIDIVECLRRIDSPVVRRYLYNPELVLIVDVYKQILGLSNTTVDFARLDFTKFTRPFWRAFCHLFEGLLDIDSIRNHPYCAIARSVNTQNNLHQPDAQEQAKRTHLESIRERHRLARQRSRIMNGGLSRERNREYLRLRRKRIQEQERLLYSKAIPTAEDLEAKRRAQQRRTQYNEKRRQRDALLRNQRHLNDRTAHLYQGSDEQYQSGSPLWLTFQPEPESISSILPTQIETRLPGDSQLIHPMVSFSGYKQSPSTTTQSAESMMQYLLDEPVTSETSDAAFDQDRSGSNDVSKGTE